MAELIDLSSQLLSHLTNHDSLPCIKRTARRVTSPGFGGIVCLNILFRDDGRNSSQP